jgi:hypothetical protein
MEQQFPLKRGNKYRARKVKIDGITFDSIAEARRYQELVVLQKAGVISGLTPHPKFHLIVNGKKIGAYTADSLYVMNGETIIEDVKSPVTLTEAARLRIKLFEALFDQTVIFVGV